MEQETKPSWEIEQNLSELARLKTAVQPYGTPDFASSLGMNSLENFQGQLQEELQASQLLESGHAAELSLEGDPVVNHTINSKFFGQLLVCLQDAVNALAFSRAKGSQPRKNLIPNNRLVLAATGPGSFAASLTMPEQQEEERLLDVPTPPEPLEMLAQLLDGSLDIDDFSEELANPQVKSQYGKVISLLAKDGADISLRTKGNPYGVRLSAQQARDRRDWLDLLRSTTEVQNMTGVLIGANIESGRFELRVGRDTFRGRASEEAAKQIQTIHLGAEVTAVIQITTTTHEDNNFVPKTSYYLESVQAEDDLVLFEVEIRQQTKASA